MIAPAVTPDFMYSLRRMHRRIRSVFAALAVAAALAAAPPACARRSPGGATALQEAEGAFLDTRALKDHIDVTRARGADRTPEGRPLDDLLSRYRARRASLKTRLEAIGVDPADPEDRRALEIMRRALEKDLTEEAGSASADKDDAATAPDCAYDPAALGAGADGFKTLSDRMYQCFGRAAHDLHFDGKTLDRLTVFSLLPVTDDAAKRRGLFLAFSLVWTAVNGDDGDRSPYRRLVRLSAARLAGKSSSIEAGARDLGIEPEKVEEWLTSVLDAWRRQFADADIEPWDFAWRAGKASRALKAVVTADMLRAVNDRFYRDLGADVTALNVRYDLDPRPSKDPVAFTTFGDRQRPDAGGVWRPGEPWVFASYAVGSLDNLNELLHETGHAVHIAAIRTRPAFLDWPDSDLFTEAIADIAGLELYEPPWQRRYLGAEVPLADSIRAKYSGIVMDVAWALFEIRMHRDPQADPNVVWTDITSRYFRIRPHPELSWWAVRGQLISLPGYMLNYAVGAILVADLRARARSLHGIYAEGDPAWYGRISEALYRYGLERTSRRVIEDFLGRPISPQALLDDMARASDRPDAGSRARP